MATEEGDGMTWVDWGIVAASLLAVLIVSIIASKRANRGAGSATSCSRSSTAGADESHSDDFFLGGRTMRWPVVALSLFASNIGTEQLVGQAGSAASSGAAVGLYEWTAVYLILTLGWFFAPFFLKRRITTAIEFFGKRYGSTARALLTLITLVAYVLTKISGSLYAGAVLLEVVLGLRLWESTPAIVVATTLYTAAGGLCAVMFTDALQASLFTVGGLIGCGYALSSVGGWPGLKDTLKDANLGYMTHLIQPWNSALYPWPAMFFFQIIGSLWYWALDAEMVQRILSTHSLKEAQSGIVAAGFLKVLPIFIVIIPGLVARALFEQCRMSNGEDASVHSWCESGTGENDLSDPHDANKAYPLLVLKEFPQGVKGIMVSCFFAAEMSSLSSVFNSSATIIMNDVYKQFVNANASSAELIRVGRIATVAMLGVSIAWLPVIETQSSELYQVIQSAQTHLAPTISVVFTLGMLWNRINGHGAVAGLVSGFIFGMIRLGINLSKNERCVEARHHTPEGPRMGGPVFACLNFNYFAGILSVFVALTTCGVSLLTPPPPHEMVDDRVVQWNKVIYNASRALSKTSSLLGLTPNDDTVLIRKGAKMPVRYFFGVNNSIELQRLSPGESTCEDSRWEASVYSEYSGKDTNSAMCTKNSQRHKVSNERKRTEGKAPELHFAQCNVESHNASSCTDASPSRHWNLDDGSAEEDEDTRDEEQRKKRTRVKAKKKYKGARRASRGDEDREQVEELHTGSRSEDENNIDEVALEGGGFARSVMGGDSMECKGNGIDGNDFFVSEAMRHSSKSKQPMINNTLAFVLFCTITTLIIVFR